MSDAAAAFLERVQALDAARRKLDVDALLDAEDREALKLQRRHRFVTFAVALAGVLLLLLGIVALGEADWTDDTRLGGPLGWAARKVLPALRGSSEVPWVESLLVLAIFLGVLGTLGQRSRWLSSRYRAERLRSLRFQVLIRPEFWKGTAATTSDCEEEIRRELEEIEDIEPDGLKTIAEREEATSVPAVEDTAGTASALLPLLARYYLDHRLMDQVNYFKKLVRKHTDSEGSGCLSRILGPFAFFASIGFVVCHLVVDWAKGAEERDSAKWLILHHGDALALFFSAAIPAVMIGVRTWRGANESARNAARSKAKLGVLEKRATALRDFSKSLEPDPRAVFGTLALTENLLRNELQDWLRLMREAEWYG
ncbi:MAG TPA: hypothetical protein VMN82_10975 [Thermoanaerobaculia bacterium]|nr:hypothetical protein [Thermoanaerobaculia bacterium]